jgi:hypothetical protein
MQECYDKEDLEVRRSAEIAFLNCAYTPEEVWCGMSKENTQLIHRRLNLKCQDGNEVLSIVLTLCMPPGYPFTEHLRISCTTEDIKSSTKGIYNAIPHLLESCRTKLVLGEDSVWVVIQEAERWISENWFHYYNSPGAHLVSPSPSENFHEPGVKVLGRRLIYSHHIISKTKRRDIMDLARHNRLSGYMKIGWPGLLLIEGDEESCISFYDDIRPWAWKFLVVRGEQQEAVQDIDMSRKFNDFTETDDMSVVANHCRSRGLEALFRTAMKVYGDEEDTESTDETMYGVMVHIDHTNNAKRYRKCLRNTSKESSTRLLLKQVYPNNDFSKRPFILGAVVGHKYQVQIFLKKWRTGLVDIDSLGKPCRERKMKVIIEGSLDMSLVQNLDWEPMQSDQKVNISFETLCETVFSIGGNVWKEALSKAYNINFK